MLTLTLGCSAPGADQYAEHFEKIEELREQDERVVVVQPGDGEHVVPLVDIAEGVQVGPEPGPAEPAGLVGAQAVSAPQPIEPAGQLSADELREVLRLAGWPEELWEAAGRVVGCESNLRPGAVGDSGRSVGLFQLNLETWFRYAGEDPEQWADPIVNARTAYATYIYDLGRGQPAWTQWTCKPGR